MIKEFKKEKKGYKTSQVDAFVADVTVLIAEQREAITSLSAQLVQKDAEVSQFRGRQDLISKAIINAVQKAEQIESEAAQRAAEQLEHLAAFHDQWLGYYDKLIQTYPLDSQLSGLNQFNRSLTQILGADLENDEKISAAKTQFESEKDRLKKRYVGFIPIENQQTGSKDEDGFEGLDEFNPEESIRQMLRRQSAEDEQKQQKTSEKNSNRPKKKLPPRAPTPPQKANPLPQNNQEQASTEDGSGFSFQEALNPTQQLSEILKEIGLDL